MKVGVSLESAARGVCGVRCGMHDSSDEGERGVPHGSCLCEHVPRSVRDVVNDDRRRAMRLVRGPRRDGAADNGATRLQQ
jgi:hypothetical protein